MHICPIHTHMYSMSNHLYSHKSPDRPVLADSGSYPWPDRVPRHWLRAWTPRPDPLIKCQLSDTRTYTNTANLQAKSHHTQNKVCYIVICFNDIKSSSVEEVVFTSCYRELPWTILWTRPTVRVLPSTKRLPSLFFF